ncbi:hypothetical protein WH96_06385 [Kiloniella spongiae]|uniref:Uncharacterized protein n=1 Tax=Kiloniella spongiae TaxID=1489064 RepID=A0A0H2MYY0_9PROT|nr:hypothetical protein [Kiloniella spongiae]KLN61900.1 hypothetical protein WH96_06385 [Kiloniella spongiae]
MKYVIEKNSSAVSQISVWTPSLANKCHLVGNSQPPKSLPFELKGGANLRLVRTVKVNPNPYQYVVDDGGALVGDEWVIIQSLQDKSQDQIAKQKRDEINPEAARRIEEIAPLWKQVRGGERAIQLIEIKSDREWTQNEAAEAAYLRTKRAEIETIRQKSNDLMSMPDAELVNVDVFNDVTWEAS